MQPFKTALYAQCLWLVAATVFNLLSLRDIKQGLPGWAGDQALGAQMVVIAMGAVIGLGLLGWLRTYRVLVIPVLVLLFAGGVLRHVIADPASYASATTWAVAIAINLFGSAAFAFGLIAVIRSRE